MAGFRLTRAYCIIILIFVTLIMIASVYLFSVVPPSQKGGHTVFYLAFTLLYIIPSLSLIILVYVVYNKPCPNSWADPYEGSGLVALEYTNDAQEYVTNRCAANNYPVILDVDSTLGNQDKLNDYCDQIQGVLVSVMYLVIVPLLNCICGIWITGGDRCLVA